MYTTSFLFLPSVKQVSTRSPRPFSVLNKMKSVNGKTNEIFLKMNKRVRLKQEYNLQSLSNYFTNLLFCLSV